MERLISQEPHFLSMDLRDILDLIESDLIRKMLEVSLIYQEIVKDLEE